MEQTTAGESTKPIEMIPDASSEPPSSLSKTQAKKLRKRQEWIAKLPERRVQEKLKKKAKKLAKKELHSNKKLNHGDQDTPALFLPPRRRHTLMQESNNKFIIAIDLDFNDFMEPAEMSKLVQQIGRIYATNRKSDHPCQLYLTSLRGKVKDYMDKSQPGYVSWDINKSDNSYLDLFANRSNKTNRADSNIVHDDISNRHIVYMSGDSENTLPEVGDIIKGSTKIFIIGGLVDHNRHKGLCRKRAIESGINTAKLPINNYVKLNQRHILSTLTVFEVLLLITGSPGITWEEALRQAIPKRKLAPDEAKCNPSDNKNDE